MSIVGRVGLENFAFAIASVKINTFAVFCVGSI